MNTESWSVSGVEPREQSMERAGTGGAKAVQEHGLSESLRELAERVRETAVRAGADADKGLQEFGAIVAGKIDGVATLLESKDMEGFREGLKGLTRENPLLVSLAAFSAGILLSRILKHSFPQEMGGDDAQGS